MKRWLSSFLVCSLILLVVVSKQLNLSASVPSAELLPTHTFTPSPLHISSCSALDTIRPASFLGYGAFDGSVGFGFRNDGTEVAYLTGFELVWPDPAHPEIIANSGDYHLRQVVQGVNATDPLATVLWTSVGPGLDATGNTKVQLPYDIGTDSGNPLEGTWQTLGVLYPGENVIWLDFDGFDGSIRQFNVLRHHFDGSRFFFSVGQPCDVLPTPTFTWTPTATPEHTVTSIPTYGPSPTPSLTLTNTLSFDPTLTTFTPPPSWTPTLTPSLTLTRTPSPTRTASRTPTTILSPTYTPTNIPTNGPSPTATLTMTPSPTPSLTPTLTPSVTLNPCGSLPTRTPIGGLTPTGGAGGDSVGVRTTPCPATFTPTVTSSVTDLPSLTPEPTGTSEPRQPVQLIVNPGMDSPIPNRVGWQVNHKPTTRKDDRMRYDADLSVFLFKGGEGENSKLKQTIRPVMLSFQTGDYLNLSMSYRKKGPQPNLRVKVNVIYRDGTPRSTEVVNLTEFVNSYRSLSYSIQLTSSAVNSIVVSFIHKSPNKKSKLFIDSVELWWMPAP